MILAFPSACNLKNILDDRHEPIWSFLKKIKKKLLTIVWLTRFVFLDTFCRLKQALMFLFLCSERSRRGVNVSEEGIIDLPVNKLFPVGKSPTS